MTQFIIQCAVCGSEYEITPDGAVNAGGKPDRSITCQVCGAVLYEYKSDVTTFGARLIASKEFPKQ